MLPGPTLLPLVSSRSLEANTSIVWMDALREVRRHSELDNCPGG